jgi:hypothetical protein
MKLSPIVVLLLSATLSFGQVRSNHQSAPSTTFNNTNAPAATTPHVFHATDYALAAGVFVARAGDWASTEECLRRPYAQCHEVELPNALVHSKAGFAAFSFGVSAASFVFQYELTKHGHRTIARVFTAAHIGMASATVIHNYQLIDNR